MCVLGEMSEIVIRSSALLRSSPIIPSCVAVLGAEAFLDAINISQTWQASFEIELTTLREECGLSIIIEFEKRCAALYLCLYHAWRCHFHDAVPVKCLSKGPQDTSTNVQDSCRSFTAHGKVPVVRQCRSFGVLEMIE